GQQYQRDDRQQRSHPRLLSQQAPAGYRCGQQVTQARPGCLAGHRVAEEQRHHDDQQEVRRRKDGEDHEVEHAGGSEVDQGGRPAVAVVAADREGQQQQEWQQGEESQGQRGAPAPQLAHQLHPKWQGRLRPVTGSRSEGVHSTASSPTSCRNASSSAWRAVTLSTPIPAPTSAETAAAHGNPSRWACTTFRSTPITSTPARPRNTAAASAGSSTAKLTVPVPATISATVPAATNRPRCITTTWLQICSTSASR